jgi:crotonobetainyl-CoA:carnitine CoA-transferase CaiB-like acyl-CoA transferase
MDISTIDFSTVLTAIIALIISLGGAVVLTGRSKAFTAVADIVKIMSSISALLVTIVDAQADDNISKEELAVITGMAKAIQVQMEQLKTDLGM